MAKTDKPLVLVGLGRRDRGLGHLATWLSRQLQRGELQGIARGWKAGFGSGRPQSSQNPIPDSGLQRVGVPVDLSGFNDVTRPGTRSWQIPVWALRASSASGTRS